MKDNIKFVQTIVIGATAFGCAYADMHPENCMILESSMLIGSEFSAVFRCNPVNINAELSKSGKDFRDELLRRNLVNEQGRISIIPISGMLSERLVTNNIPVQLMSCIESIDKTEEGYRILYFGMDGYSSVCCKYIIDTTQTGTCHALVKNFNYVKSLSAMLSADALVNMKEICKVINDNVSVMQGRFETELVFRVYTDKNENYSNARESMFLEWARISEKELCGLRIASISAFFDYEYENHVDVMVDDDFRWIPSASYHDVLEAFEAGASL